MADQRPSDGTLTDPNDIARLQEGISALQSGERDRARDIFAALVQRAYRDANAWIGLAMSSDDVHEAYGALRNARLIQPDNPFVERAAADLARRWPAEAEREAAMLTEPPIVGPVLPAGLPGGVEEGAPAEGAPPTEVDDTAGGARLATGSRRAVETAPPSRRLGWRVLTTLVLGAGFVALVAVLIFGLQNAEIFQPVRPTATTTPPPTLAPPRTPQAPPTIPARTAIPVSTGSPVVLPPLTPSSAEAARQRAIEAVQAGRFTQAVPLLEQATARDPQDAEALYYLGLAYLNAGDPVNGPGDALRTFRSVTALRPEWAPGLQLLAEALMQQRPPQYREAVPPARQAAQLDPSRAEPWLTLARAYEGAGDPTSATVAYNEAARHSPAPPPLLPTPPPPSAPATATATATPVPVSPSVAPPLPTTPPNADTTPGAAETPTLAEIPATPVGETPTP